MRKRILSLILSLAAILPMCIAANAEGNTEISFETKVMRGLFVVDSDFETNPDDTISRGDFVRILMDMIACPGDSSFSGTPLSDLPEAASYTESVIAAVNRGYISGYGDGTFRPKQAITPMEAATAILKTAGYDAVAVANGGYSKGYLSLAQEQDLLDGIATGMNEAMTKAEVAKMLYNALSVEVYELTSVTGSQVEMSRNGELFASEFMDLVMVRDIITSNYLTSLTGNATCQKDEITIGNNTVNLEYEKANEYLGYSVEAYIRQDDHDEETLVFAIPYKTNTIELKADIIEESTTDTRVYYEDGDDIKNFKVDASADKIVNGKANLYKSLTELLADADSVLFIDNDNDGEYEVAVVYAYEEMYVNSVNLQEEIIYNRYTYPTAVQMLDLEDADEVIIIKNSEPAELSDISVGDVLTFTDETMDDYRVVTIYVSQERASGTVNMIDKDEDSVYIDNAEYTLSKMYTDALSAKDFYAKELKVGSAVTAYLNSFGKIAVVQIDDASKKYGYLKRAYYDDTGIETAVKFKILGTDGDWQTYELKEKVSVGNNKYNSESLFSNAGIEGSPIDVMNGCAIPQLLEFELDRESKIKGFSTAQRLDNPESDKFRYINVSNLIYRSANASFDSNVYISGVTATYTIPSLDEEGKRYSNSALSQIPDEYFTVDKGTAFTNGTTYSVNAYNCDKYGYTDLVVRDVNLAASGHLETSDFIMTGITQAIDSDEEVQTLLEGVHGTNLSANVPLSSNVQVYDESGNLKSLSYLGIGDMLNLTLNADYDVSRIDVAYKWEKDKMSKLETSLHANVVRVFGKVNDIDHERGFVLLNDGLTNLKKIRLYKDKLSVYKCDLSAKKDKISVGNINDIQKGDYVVMSGGVSQFKYVIIYK